MTYLQIITCLQAIMKSVNYTSNEFNYVPMNWLRKEMHDQPESTISLQYSDPAKFSDEI